MIKKHKNNFKLKNTISKTSTKHVWMDVVMGFWTHNGLVPWLSKSQDGFGSVHTACGAFAMVLHWTRPRVPWFS